MEDKKLLSLKEAAEMLGIHYTTMRQYVRKGKFPVVRIGRLLKIEAKDIEDYIKNNKTILEEKIK
ncbi:MAG: helix-turn-helix domain-containing protein [Caldisericia bacterium]|nr:helix-turn-helix domain-containing protein [Caldisericia bacterium]